MHRLIDSLDADDVFISYSRTDDSAYVTGIDAALSARGFACFSDKRGTDANPLPPQTLYRKVRLCKTLVLLGTPGAVAKPENIEPEVREFAEANGTARIIPISFDHGIELTDWSGASWYPYVVGKWREREEPAALKSGEPRQDIVDNIVTASDYMRSKDRLRRDRNRALGTRIRCERGETRDRFCRWRRADRRHIARDGGVDSPAEYRKRHCDRVQRRRQANRGGERPLQLTVGRPGRESDAARMAARPDGSPERCEPAACSVSLTVVGDLLQR